MDKRELQMLRYCLSKSKDINKTIKKNTESVYNMIIMYTLLETMTKERVKVTVLHNELGENGEKIYFSGLVINDKKFNFPPIGPIDSNQLFCMIALDGFLVETDLHDITLFTDKSILERVLIFNKERQKQKKLK